MNEHQMARMIAMSSKQLLPVLAALTVALGACSKEPADAPCDAVVAKLASFNAGSGEAEKKLWGKMCADMPPAVRGCIANAKTLPDSQKCMGDQKLK